MNLSHHHKGTHVRQKSETVDSVNAALRSIDECFALPSIRVALNFRAEQMGWTSAEMARHLGMQRSHYGEVLNGIRSLPLRATKKAYALGVPASVLLQ